MSLEKVPKVAWAGAGLIVVAIIVVVVLLVTGSSSSGENLSFSGNAYPGVDLASTRHVSGSPIDSSSVSELKEAWSLPATARSSYGAYSASPVISNGVVYMQDLESNVQAISLANGKVQWTKTYGQPDQGPNGVSVAEGRVYGATPTSAFALDQKTGEQLWQTKLTKGVEAIDMPAGVHAGIVYLSTVPTTVTSAYPAGGVGTLWALDAKTGRKLWHFNTVPPSLWGDKGVNAGGGVWYEPAFDGEGSMYFGVGNPVPFPGSPKGPWGSSRPGPNLYTDSIVKLDAKTGKLRWYYQLTPHDLYDWDLQDPPMLIKAGGRQLAIAAGKSGIVLAVDAKTGKPVWKRPVGTHNGHDHDGLYAMRHEYGRLKTNATVFPGTLGGVIAPMATDGSTIFVPVVNHSLTVVSPSELSEGSSMSGELVALDAASGKVKWKRKLPSAAFGAPVVVNDVVFASSYEGSLYAFDAGNGDELWTATLPAGVNAGLAVSGDTLVAPAGAAVAEGQTPALVAYRLGG